MPLVEPPQIFGFPVACRGHGLRQSGEDGAGEPHVIFLPVTVDGGANTSKSGGYWHIPKRDLVHAGIVAFQNRRLHVAKLRYRGVLEEELKNYRIKQNLVTGYAGFEPLREGQHDDLLFATCLGVWAWERAGLFASLHLHTPPQHVDPSHPACRPADAILAALGRDLCTILHPNF